MENVLSTLTKGENKPIYIMGDFNINLLNEDVRIPTNEFIDNDILLSLLKYNKTYKNNVKVLDSY